MIWQLTREQLRSQRRFVAWTAALLTVAIALASYAAITTTTQISNDLHAQRIAGADKDFQGFVSSAIGPDQDLYSESADSAPIEQVDTQIADALASGSDLQARRYTALNLTGPTLADGSFDDSFFTRLVSVTGDYDWEAALVSGTAPTPGEVAISGQLASVLDVEIGGVVPTFTQSLDSEGVPSSRQTAEELVVSGITRGSAFGRNYDIGIPEAYVAWEDSVKLAIAGAPENPAPADIGLEQPAYVETNVSWNQASTPLTAFSMIDGYFGSSAGRSDSSGVSVAIAVALFIGLIAMSFAVGRSQAQARTTWAATARAMGARRSTIAAATIAETLVVGLAASVLGIVLGWLAVVADLALIRNSVPDAFLPSAPVVVWWVLGTVLLLGLVIAAIVGAVPAFWAARVSPVAALKPVSPIMEAEVSRRVSVRGVAIIWGISVVLVWFSGARSDADQVLAALNIFALIAFVILTFVLTQELLREAMPRLGRMLGRSARPWAITAGDSIVARPRQSAIPALVITIAAFGGVASATFTYMDNWLVQTMWNISGEFGWLASSYGFSGTTVGVAYSLAAIVAVLIALAIFASGSRASLSDDATRGALGMTVADARRARAAHFGLPLATGVALGWILGLAGGIILSLRSHQTGALGAGYNWPLAAIPSTITPNLVVVAISLVVVAIGAGIVAVTTSHRTPVDDLSRV